jgi:hypothetical protein
MVTKMKITNKPNVHAWPGRVLWIMEGIGSHVQGDPEKDNQKCNFIAIVAGAATINLFTW